MAAAAMSNGINANLLRRWVMSEPALPPAVGVRPGFVALPMPSAANATSQVRPGDCGVARPKDLPLAVLVRVLLQGVAIGQTQAEQFDGQQ